MLVAAITGTCQAGLFEKPALHAQDDLVVVKVYVTPMCTEYKLYRAGRPTDMIGHEAAGEVVDVARPGTVKVGDRVVVMPLYACGTCALCMAGDYIYCQNTRDMHAETGMATGVSTYAQYILKPDYLLLPIPDDLSYTHASMACCGLGATFGAMQALEVDAFDVVLITGMGPVGLGGVINACAGYLVHPLRKRGRMCEVASTGQGPAVSFPEYARGDNAADDTVPPDPSV